MFYIVETQDQLNKFCYKGYEEAFVEIIPHNDSVHPAVNQISLIYIRPLKDTKGYMLCIDHSESLSLSLEDAIIALSSINKIYVADKKTLLHYFVLRHAQQLHTLPSPP